MDGGEVPDKPAGRRIIVILVAGVRSYVGLDSKMDIRAHLHKVNVKSKTVLAAAPME